MKKVLVCALLVFMAFALHIVSVEAQQGEQVQDNRVYQYKPQSPFIVNLAESQGSRQLKVDFVVEFKKDHLAASIPFHQHRFRNAVIMLLSSKSLGDVDTSEGKLSTRDEIIQEINKVLGEEIVTGLYYMDFVIQQLLFNRYLGL